MASPWLAFLVLFIVTTSSKADLPVNCTIDEVLGDWMFYEGKASPDSSINCDKTVVSARRMKISLLENGKARQDDWIVGVWTMVYNEGIEVTIGFRTYFANFKYKQEGKKVTSYCYLTSNGKSHDVTLRNYACFYAKQLPQKTEPKVMDYPFSNHHVYNAERLGRNHLKSLVDEVNGKNTTWTATVHDQFVDMSFEQLQNIAGGRRSWLPWRPKPKISTVESTRATSFDWRNYNGSNYVSPVRNQGSCGSCYAFSSAGMLENRIRVFSNNQLQPILSTQDIVSCTSLAQGCAGGFPFLIAGRYGWETGFVDEGCNPYKGKDSKCIKEACDRWYVAAYSYVGGYFGACSENAMIAALMNGPIAVSFEVYPDFVSYKSGIYRRTNSLGTWEHMKKFETVNHAVLLVGYGEDESSGDKFWIVKNSWGEKWGENGYFRILRGVDEVGIESIAVQAFPIPKY